MSLRFGTDDFHERRPVLALLAMTVTTFTGALHLPASPEPALSPQGTALVAFDMRPSLPVLADLDAFKPCRRPMTLAASFAR